MYNKTDIERIATETHFIRDNVEKAIRLCDILCHINSDGVLSENLVLKGGTAINLLLTPLYRLSVDIDFDFNDNCEKTTMLRKRKVIAESIDAYMHYAGYRRSPHSKSPMSIDSWIYQYTNTAGNLDNIKLEINYSMRCHLLQTEKRPIQFPYFNSINIHSLNTIELYATKIKALLERGAARDLFDVHKMIECNIIDESQKPLLRKSIVFYQAIGGSNKPSEYPSMDSIDTIQFKHIRASLLPMLKKSTFFELDKVKEAVSSYLSSLLILTEQEKEFVKQFNLGNYHPELLFDDNIIIERVANHPMALWKTKRNSL